MTREHKQFILIDMLKWKKTLLVSIIVFILAFFAVSCSDSRTIVTLGKENLFTLKYGNFEDQINLFNLSATGGVSTSIVMRDGFFYIANSEAQKILQLNSYGDLLALYYNPETNPVPSFKTDAETAGSVAVTQKAIEYQFNKIGSIAVDNNKLLYVVDSLPPVRQEKDIGQGLVLSQVVLRFDSSGSFIDYLGQQGPGGTPFPYIRNLFTTANNELVVVCNTGKSDVVYWFSEKGYLLYTIPFEQSDLPNPFVQETSNEIFTSLDTIVPDSQERKLYLKIDYYVSVIDAATKVQSGIDYYQTLLYPFDIESGKYENSITVPALEMRMESSFSDTVYQQPYEFLGVTHSGWFFFIAADSSGYMLQIIQSDGRKILRRHLTVEQKNSLYYAFDLSSEGIISALLAGHENVSIAWWRADELIESLVKQ